MAGCSGGKTKPQSLRGFSFFIYTELDAWTVGIPLCGSLSFPLPFTLRMPPSPASHPMLSDLSQLSPDPPLSPAMNVIHPLPSSHGISTLVGGNPQTPIPPYHLNPLVTNSLQWTPHSHGLGGPQFHVNPTPVGDQSLVGG